MGRRLASTVHVTDPGTRQTVALVAGSEVPSWAEELIDPSRFEGQESAAIDVPDTPDGPVPQRDDADSTPAPAGDRPNRSAAKGEWVDYAVAQGADRNEAEDLTKDDLIDRYGG